MLLCLHEESAVAIAHGYAKATGRMMGAVLHSNVGLMHAHDGDLQRLVRPRADADPRRHRPVGRGAAPAVDRLDPHRRRPGRAGARLHQVGQPARRRSPAAYEALLRAAQIAQTPRRAARPTSTSTQRCRRRRSAPMPPLPEVSRFARAGSGAADARCVCSARRSCSRARRIPVILAGRVGRSLDGWKARVALAEKLQAQGLHRHQDAGRFPDRSSAACRAAGDVPADGKSCCASADVVLSLDWVDTAGTLKAAWGDGRSAPR